MDLNAVQQRHSAHLLIDSLEPEKLSTVLALLELIVDPVARSVANAPVDDEPLTDQEQLSLNEASQWLKHNQPIPHAEVLAELGITQQEIDEYADLS